MSDWVLMLCLNAAACTVLALALMHRRWLLLKPSVVFIGYYQVSVMWPGLSWFGYLTETVPAVREYIWALHGTGLAATLLSVGSWRGTTRRLARRLQHRAPPAEASYRQVSLVVLGGFVVLVTLWYVGTLGWGNTGLSAILSGSEDNAQTREGAMKLLGSRVLQYAWALMAYAAAYLLGYWLAFSAVDLLRTKRPLPALLCLLAFFLLLIVVVLPGARGPAAMLVLATLAAFYARSGFRIGLIRVSIIIAATLAMPALLTLWRNGETPTPSNFATYYLDILDRVSGRSVQDNIWMVSYAQQEGFFGAEGIPLFARLAGAEPLNVFNLVGLYFRPNGLESISANSSSIAVNYGCFGLIGGLALSLSVTLGIDSILLFYTRLPSALLAPCAGICAVISVNFAMTNFSTVFVTHGLLPTIAFCYGVHFIRRNILSRKPVRQACVKAGAGIPMKTPDIITL